MNSSAPDSRDLRASAISASMAAGEEICRWLACAFDGAQWVKYTLPPIRMLAPDIQFLGEETGLQRMNADCYWILDPVDGTTNLMHDYQHSVVSLALCLGKEIVWGIVYDPFHDELFSAVKGEGSFLNGKPIHVSSAQKLPETIIGVGTAKRELAEENFARFLKVYESSQDIRRLGSAALELAYTACGRQGGYFEVYLNPWDYAAGMLLVQEAGGKVTDWKGNALDPAQGSQVCGTNGQVHEELLKLLL